MQKYKSNITTTSGAAVRNVPVHVLKEDGAPASLFLDRDGMVPAPNPLTTGADGTFYFYAVNGRYSLRTTVDGVTITDADVVLLMDVEEIAFAGPIADAVQAAESAAGRAEAAVAGSGITELVSTAQNAVVDANAALISANAAATSADLALANAVAAKDAADLSASAANTAAANAALAADSASLNYKTAIRAFETYAAANAAVGSLADGSIIEVSQDETRAGARTRYKVQAGALVFVVNLDQMRLDLAAPSGASLVGFGSGTVADQLVKVQEGKYATNGGRIGVTSDSVPLASPGALVHIVNKSVTAGLRVSSYWAGSTAAPYQNNDDALFEVFNKVNSNSLNLSWGGSFANAYNNIPAGVTDSGERVGVLGWATSVKTADYTHSGTLEYQFGLRGRAGFQGPGTPATAVVNNAIGVRGEISNDSVGATIANARAGEFLSSGGAGTVVNNIAVYAGATGGTAVNYSFYGESGKLFNTGQILAGSTATQSNSKVGARGAANSFEFGNPDPTGYGSNIGSTTSSGYPFIAFCAEADASGNTFRTRGKLGTVIHGGLDGSLLFGRLTNANAGGQSITYSAIINPSGQLSLSETVVLKSKTPASATAPGVAGEVCWDAGYVYVCVATNAWRRAALAAW